MGPFALEPSEMMNKYVEPLSGAFCTQVVGSTTLFGVVEPKILQMSHEKHPFCLLLQAPPSCEGV